MCAANLSGGLFKNFFMGHTAVRLFCYSERVRKRYQGCLSAGGTYSISSEISQSNA